ncbi:MscL family protein [Mycoplasmopsis felifaucium]|uniref:MscL family protein n=1 Tax=Mycoplasmopsis felifaucium TaxID=35768 RepID=A0ABZ2RQ41_9BACT
MFRQSCKDAWNVVKRGNMFMLAIGLLLGSSFNAVVSSFANDIIMGAISKAFHVQDVVALKIAGISVGKFFAALISFFIVMMVIFVSLIIVFTIKNSLEQRRLKKNPPVEITVAPSTDQLMLNELKKINERLARLEQQNTPND